MAAGDDDSCKSGVEHGSGGCVHDGLSCGGDKVTGFRNDLYRCTSGDHGTEVQHCAHGCNVNPHANDSCE